MTRLPVEIIQATLDVCLNECNWLTVNGAHEAAGIPHEAAGIPHDTDEEGKGTEQKGKKDATPNKSESYHPDSRTALHWLNEKTGRHYRETDGNLVVISARLKEEDVDIEGVKAMIDRQCAVWGPDPKMCEFLRPETLFGKSKFDGYYAARFADVKHVKGNTPPPSSGEFCEGWMNKPASQMTDREALRYVQA